MECPEIIIPPAKRRRRNRNTLIVDGTPDALDTGIFERTSASRLKTFVPQSVDPVPRPVAGEAQLEPEPDFLELPEDVSLPSIKQSSQEEYLKEFVSRVDELLEALMTREALPNDGCCMECGNQRPGRWRCKDCTTAPLLCRSCMRHTHRHNPLHRIECWTGNYFRAASLWEVGTFILVPHKNGPTLCPSLQWQTDMLEIFQKTKDDTEMVGNLDHNQPDEHLTGNRSNNHASEMSAEKVMEEEAWMDAHLDRMYERHENHETVENDENDEAADADDDDDIPILRRYLAVPVNLNSRTAENVTSPAPSRDGLYNQYVRVIHNNGVHHIGLVTCACQGSGRLPVELMQAGYMTTSFKRIRTMFTTSVLDLFRYSNLEMKASAYQFFQLLCRLTSPMAPSDVVDFYHQLRRLSRVWRWMKKLKWAGHGHTTNPRPPGLGELTTFCPACPQIGINVSENWEHDPNRCRSV